MTLTLLFNEKVNKVLAEFKWPLWCLYKHFRSLIDDVSESSSKNDPKQTIHRMTILLIGTNFHGC